MNPPVADRNPYGAWYMTPGGLPSPVNDPGPAIARARKKLRQIREHPETEQPLRAQARPWLSLAAYMLLVSIGTLVGFAAFGNAMLPDWRIFTTFLVPCSLLTLLVLRRTWRDWSAASTRSPEEALDFFLGQFRSIIGGTGHTIVVSSDNDDFVRHCPKLDGRAKSGRYQLNDVSGRRQYWSGAVDGKVTWQNLRLTETRSAKLSPDFAVVEACVSVVASGRSPTIESLFDGVWATIAFLSALPVIADSIVSGTAESITVLMMAVLCIPIATTLGFQIYKLSGGHAHQFRLRKLIVRVHGEWRVFNGELQGPEEGDLSWLADTQPQE